jgi:hypothetical protein
MNRHPRLRSDLVIVEQTYRGERSYVVKDATSRKYFRFRALEVAVMQELDGHRSPAEIATALAADGIPIKPAAVENFARRLKEMGLVERSVAERSVLLLERLRADRRRRLKTTTSYRGSIFRMRWSIGDPDQMLERWLPRFRFMFTPRFIAVSIALFLIYALVCVSNWPVFADAISRLYTPSRYTVGMFATFYLTGLVIIAIHELGHAFACKYFGGRVHEMGAMLVYFEPAFYCNVNDSWTFPELRQRMWVTVAGSWIQMVLASVAAIIWWLTEPGTLINEIAIAAVLIGGITTVIANINPLIPLDGYYALSDYLEVPNLRQRAFGYLAWLIKHRVLGLEQPPPVATDREKRIFLIYGVLATLYITSLFGFIAGLIFGWLKGFLGALGVLLFAFSIWLLARGAIKRAFQLVIASIREHRARWKTASFRRKLFASAIGLVLVLVLPWPHTVNGPFEAAGIRSLDLVAPESGVVDRVYAVEGTVAAAGAPIIRIRSSALEQRAVTLRRLRDSVAMLEVRARVRGNHGLARQHQSEAAEVAAELVGTEERMRSLTLRAPVHSAVVTPRMEELVGMGTVPGQPLTRLVQGDSLELRIELHGAGVSLVRPGQRVRIVSYANPDRPIESTVTSVATASDSTHSNLEVRVRVPALAGWWRPGVTGEAEVMLRRATVGQTLWWSLRSRIRRDLLL